MSQRREKRRRAIIRRMFRFLHDRWESWEPPWWRFIRRRHWKSNEPTMKTAERLVKWYDELKS